MLWYVRGWAATAAGRQDLGELVLTVVLILVLLSWTVTLAAFARLRKRVAGLKAQASGGASADPPPAWDRLVDTLAPDPVMISTFPQTNVATDLLELTGGQRTTVRLPGLRGSGEEVATSRPSR